MTAQRAEKISPTEYLRLERSAPFKSEYFAGEIFAMAGASPEHNLITGNVLREVGQRLKGTPCRAYASDLRVFIPLTGLYTYPDVSVICGSLEFSDDDRETVTNPTLIVEVLSNTTEAYDRGVKFEHYRSVPSIAEYVLISQATPTVEVFHRQPSGSWELSPVRGLDAASALRTLHIDLPLAEIYYGVEFPANPPLKVTRT